METTEQYLENVTLIADFWIADQDMEIQSVVNEGVMIRKSKSYLNKYHIHIIMKTAHYGEMDLFAKDWQQKFPKAVITKGTGKVEAYDLRFLHANEKDTHTTLEFIGELVQ